MEAPTVRTRILGQPIDVISLEEALYIIESCLKNSNQLKIVTLNPEMVILAEKNIEFQAAINNANLIIPDGTGIIWALKKQGLTSAKRIPGIELTERILDIGDNLKKKVAIFGSKKQVLELATCNLKHKFSNINFVKAIHGYQSKDKDSEVADEIAKEFPDIVIVALGTPRQEIWINKYAKLFPRSILIGVGGSLDIFSGKKKRAPKWLRDCNLEWLYRMITEPKRTVRILRSLPLFVWKILRKTNSKF